jgi:chromosome segregation ATPase
MTWMKRAGLIFVIAVAIAAASAWRPVAAQTPKSEDVLPALLTEVKGLRAAIEQMTSSGTQAQLLLGRLQLQEARVTSMIRRLDTVRDSLASARREYDQINSTVRMLDNHQETPTGDTQIARGAAAAKSNVDRLAAEEQQLVNDIASEQARWVDISQRLDALERQLARK